MDLCQEVLDGISLLKNTKRITRDELTSILQIVSDSLRNNTSDDGGYLKRGDLKLATLSLSCLMIESCRQNLGINREIEMLKTLLEDCHVEPEYSTLILTVYTTLRDDLNGRLERIRIKDGSDDSMKEIIDVDWRQEILLKTNFLDKLSQLQYFISLKTNHLNNDDNNYHEDDASRNETIDFSCSLQDLTDLLYKIKECSKAVENVLQ